MASWHYRHTQIGWVVIVVLVILAGLIAVLMALLELYLVAAISGGITLLCAVMFGTLTVQVDETKIRFWLGPRLIRKTIELADVRQFSAVKNPWYYGWGIHFIPGGIVYNVSGFGAVEVLLKTGKRIRIGTDEPEALARAIEQVAGKLGPLSPEEVAQGKRIRLKGILVGIGITLLVFGGLAGLFSLEERPPEVSIDAETFAVESFMYEERFALRDITYVGLERRLPRIRVRTNGYALGGTLRGHFRLDQLGDGQLFIEAGTPPYVLARRGSDYVIVNFEDPSRTQQLFRELHGSWSRARGE